MSVKPNATPDEFDSPHFKEHQALCKRWEQYITEKQGKIIGHYNAWSFRLKCKVQTPNTWIIDITKTTFHDGHLFWTSKRQGLTEVAVYQTLLSTDCPNFSIKRSRLSGSGRKHQDAKSILEMVRPAIENGSLRELHLKNKRLSITLYHKNEWFDFTERLLTFHLK